MHHQNSAAAHSGTVIHISMKKDAASLFRSRLSGFCFLLSFGPAMLHTVILVLQPLIMPIFLQRPGLPIIRALLVFCLGRGFVATVSAS
jgi:hypothetical protein